MNAESNAMANTLPSEVASTENEIPEPVVESCQATGEESISMNNETPTIQSDAKLSSGPSDTGDELSMNNEEENNTDTDNTENIQVEANKHLETQSQGMTAMDVTTSEVNMESAVSREQLEHLQLDSKMQ